MILNNHGGSCCGVRHVYNMDNGTEAELQRLIAGLDNEPGQGNRLIEIILSQRQVEMPRAGGLRERNPEGGWPAIMLRNGFRLVSRFNNSNSDNDCYIFHRVPRFKSISSRDLPFEWDYDYTPQPQQNAGGPGHMVNVPAQAPFEIGDRVRYTAVGNHRTGQEGVIGAVGETITVRWDRNNETIGGYSGRNLLRIAPRAQPAPAPAPRVVYTAYANFLTRTGQRGGQYPTLEAARLAAPRCRRQDRLDVMSDGTQRWTDNV